MDETHTHQDVLDDEIIEAYCVRCRESVEVENPEAVWTRKGMPATRGECPICGGTVFRMGKTHMHDESHRPEPVDVTGTRRKGPKLAPSTVYVMYAEEDEEIAQQIADDLGKVGLAPWLHEHVDKDERVAWAGGVHPALAQCSRMVYVMSYAALEEEQVREGWRFFRDKRKPIVIAQLADVAPPDDIRRSPRFDFTQDYRRAFREMVQALAW